MPRVVIRERDWQQTVIALARTHGWRVAHFRPARVLRGGVETYRTPVQADGKGWPDLFCIRGDRAVAIELKTEHGKLTPEQRVWLDALAGTGKVETMLARPSDWDALVELLR